jgi:hypothetical protein
VGIRKRFIDVICRLYFLLLFCNGSAAIAGGDEILNAVVP